MKLKKAIYIGRKIIGETEPAYIVAEMSANHNMDFNRAKAIIRLRQMQEQMQ